MVLMSDHRAERCGVASRILVWAFLLATMLILPVFTASADERTIRLETATTYTVPAGKSWVFRNLEPWSAPGKVGTADFAIKGSASFGKEQILIDGAFEVVVKRRNMPFTVKSGSTIEVLDSRGTAMVIEIDG